MPITLNSVTQTEKLSVINDNFQKIEDAINGSLLWREGSTAGEAQMSRSLDMNNGQILNALVGSLRLSELAEDITASVASASASASSAASSAVTATGAASSASSSATAAANSAASVSGATAQIAQNTSDIGSLQTRMTAEETKVQSIALGGTGNTTGLAASATKLATARTIQINLASSSSSSFDGTANITPGVTGALPIANGGTAATSAATALSNLGGIPLAGVTTAPGAGVVGEVLENTTTGVALTTSTFANVTTLSLTAGVWEVSGAILLTGSAAVITAYNVGIGQTSATAPGFPRALAAQFPALTQIGATIPTQRIVLTATSTIYLVGWSVFASGTVTANGFIHAHRVR